MRGIGGTPVWRRGSLCRWREAGAVSTEIHVGGLSSSIPGAIELTGEFDRVLHTAADRPHTDTLPALRDPAADHGDVDLKHRQRRRRGKARADPAVSRCVRARRRRARAGRLGGLVHFGRRSGAEPGLRAKLDPAVHQPDVAGRHRRQRSEQPRLRGRAGGTGFSAQGAPLVRRSVPGRRGALSQQAGRDRSGLERLLARSAAKAMRCARCAAS